jgi:hypothetical protein
MTEDPYSNPGEGHRCSFSPTGWCRVDLASEACARAKGCAMPDENGEVAPI